MYHVGYILIELKSSVLKVLRFGFIKIWFFLIFTDSGSTILEKIKIIIVLAMVPK